LYLGSIHARWTLLSPPPVIQAIQNLSGQRCCSIERYRLKSYIIGTPGTNLAKMNSFQFVLLGRTTLSSHPLGRLVSLTLLGRGSFSAQFDLYWRDDWPSSAANYRRCKSYTLDAKLVLSTSTLSPRLKCASLYLLSQSNLVSCNDSGRTASQPRIKTHPLAASLGDRILVVSRSPVRWTFTCARAVKQLRGIFTGRASPFSKQLPFEDGAVGHDIKLLSKTIERLVLYLSLSDWVQINEGPPKPSTSTCTLSTKLSSIQHPAFPRRPY
jgi:hypothetical protein